MILPDTSRLEFDAKKHCYKLDGHLLSGVTSVIDGTSSKQNLIGWAANMAVDYIKENGAVHDTKKSCNECVETNAYSVATSDLGMSEKDVVCYHEERTVLTVNLSVVEEARTAYAKKRDKAASKGTDTHALVEQYILDCIDEFGGKPLPAIMPTEIDPFKVWAIANVDCFIAAEQRLYSEKHGFAGTCDFIAIIDGKITIGDLKTYPKMWSADAFIQMGAYSICWEELTGVRPGQSVVVKMCDPEDERLKKYGGNAFSVYPRYAIEEDEEMFLTRLSMYRYNEAFVSPKD